LPERRLYLVIGRRGDAGLGGAGMSQPHNFHIKVGRLYRTHWNATPAHWTSVQSTRSKLLAYKLRLTEGVL
jgi:hypothetical protein